MFLITIFHPTSRNIYLYLSRDHLEYHFPITQLGSVLKLREPIKAVTVFDREVSKGEPFLEQRRFSCAVLH